MAENLRDVAVTRQQHEAYLRDPSDPRAMPYSRKQLEANAAHARTTLYHSALGARTFHNSELADGIPEGWHDAPVKAVNEAIEAEPEPQSAELDALRAECDREGIAYDKRWGREKMRNALLKNK